MEWIEPVALKSTVKFSSSPSSPVHDASPNYKRGSLPDTNIAWFATEDRLDIVSTAHSGVQSRQFQCSQGQDFEVTFVTSIQNEPLALVGLSSNTGSGAVALYNYSTSMILNSWSISHRVTCLCSIDDPNGNYKHVLKSDCYLFALGTEEGHVMLMAIDQRFKFTEGTHQLDLNIVHYYTTDDILCQRALFKPPVVVVIPLNDPMFRAGRFVLESMHESQAVLSTKQEDIAATVVKFIPQTQSLCVGYNMQGAFQLFSLKTLDLDFSGFASGCNTEQLDQILDFAFLEPEDDPRHYCYLAVVASKSNGSYHSPFVVLYSLTYAHKDTAPDRGIFYDELQYITPRLDINFGPLIMSEGLESDIGDVELVTIRSLPSSFTSPANVNSTRATPCNGLCYLAMQSNSTVYFALFDLNQWYQAQMPSRWIFDDLSTVCPFVGFYRVRMQSSEVRQVWIDSDSLSIFHRSSITPNEVFFYPSALSFRAVVVSPAETESVLFLGLQSLLLHKLSQSGSQALNQPQRHYIHAVKAGLTPAEVAAPTVFQMAEALLNIGLENNSRSFLTACIKDEGANLNFVEKWAWQQVVNLKTHRENLCQILFDHSAQELEQQMHTQLYHVTHQFNNLAVLYDVMDKKIRSLNSGVNDKLREKARAIHLLSLHLETVLWFLHGGLLPEVDEGEGETSALPYPRHQMEQFYRNRKREIESLSSSVKAQEVLLIEQLVPKSVSELWAEERGSNELTYPPPSLYALLSAYLRPDVDDVTKHRLVQYVFMDLTWIYERHEHFGNILQHLVTFPSTYSLKPSTIKVTQAFWHLDHQNFDDALGVLLDPLVHAADITNAQQRAILRAFLYQDQRRHALKYATLRHPVCPELEDIQLHLTILIANNLISDALNYIRRNRNQRNGGELMQHLLSGCHEMRKFSVLLTLPLTDEEEEHVTGYLKQSRSLDLQEALLLYYIQRCKYPDAIAYNQRLNQMWPARDATSRERYNRREMLMQTLIGALPPITCKLASIVNSRPTGAVGGNKHPKPLSIAVLPSTSKVQSQGSNFFRTVIEQSRATWLIEQKMHEEVQSPLRTRKRKLDVPEEPALEPETTPFLCNIVQPSKRNVTLGMSLAFPSPKVTDASAMDITEIEHDVTQPKQSKRPRYSLFPKPIAPKTNSEVVSILNTPPIRRSRPSLATGEAPGSCNRPSSILKDKMKRFMNFSAFETSMPGTSTDAQQSEQDADMEVSMLDVSSAKQLRFSLPRAISMEQASPEQAPADREADVSMSEKAEDSQFLSFEESENEEGSSPVKETVRKEEITIEKQESETVIDASDDRMELTTMNPVVIESTRKSVVRTEELQEEGHILDAVTKETEVTETLTVEVSVEREIKEAPPVEEGENIEPEEEEDRFAEEPVEELEKSAEDEELAGESVEEEEHQVAVQQSDSESDIVCLDSDSDEEPQPVRQVEEAEDEEEAYGAEEEYAEEEEEEEGVAEVGEEAETDENNEEEEEEQDEVEPVESASSNAQNSSVVELLSDEDRELMSVAESAREGDHRTLCQTVDMSTSEEIKQETEELPEDEGSVVEEKSVEESDSEAVEEEEIATTTIASSKSMSITRQRFAMSSDEESSGTEAEEEREKELLEYARRRHPNVSGFSEVEPDVESESSASPARQEEAEEENEQVDAQMDVPVYSPVESDVESGSSASRQEKEEEENEQSEARMDVPVYSPVESDVESGSSASRGEGAEEESEQPEVQIDVPVYSPVESDVEDDEQEVMDVDEGDSPVKASMADESIVMERSVPLSTMASVGTVQETEEQEYEEEEDGENFELRFSDTPNVTRRASQFLKRFSLGSAAGSDDEQEEQQQEQQDEKDQLALEESVAGQQLVEPEESPTKPVEVEDSDSADDKTPAKFVAARSTRSSMFRTRLQWTDSESSDNEEVDVPAVEVKPETPKEQVEDVQPVEEVEQGHGEEVLPEPVPEPSTSVETEQEDVAGQETEEPAAQPETEIAERAESEERECETTDRLADEVSQHSDASTIENENLKQILERHERFDVPLIPDAGVLITDRDLSTIVEERTFDQSIAPGLSHIEKTTLESLEEEQPDVVETASETGKLVEDAPEKIAEPEPVAEIVESPEPESDSACKVDTLDAGMMNEAGPLNLTDNEEEEEKERVEVRKRGGVGRSKSLRLSQVPLPFTSRKSVWDASSRDRSPESATSEPPQSLEESTVEITKGRRRRHSASLSSAPIPTRRSTRLSTQLNETIGTPVKEEPSTPPKSGRLSRLADEKHADDAFIPPSIDVSPAESSYSGRSSLVGTPVRRSARIAMKERTPEPSAPTEALMSSLSRVRRHSTGPGDVASPVRRSGRKSLNASRENSPDSITSEPPPRTESTPSRRTKSTRGLRSAQKVAHNLFPVEEEGEASNEAPSAPPSVRDSDDSISIDDAESVADTSVTSISSKRGRKPRGQQTSRPSSVASSVTSSPGATRYNLRRTRRASELDIVPEEEQNRAEEVKAESANKRGRDAASDEDSSPEQAGPSNEGEIEQPEKTKRSGRPKRRKKAEEEEGPAEEIHFAPASRPPPKNLPKREPVIKSRSSIRRSMKLDK